MIPRAHLWDGMGFSSKGISRTLSWKWPRRVFISALSPSQPCSRASAQGLGLQRPLPRMPPHFLHSTLSTDRAQSWEGGICTCTWPHKVGATGLSIKTWVPGLVQSLLPGETLGKSPVYFPRWGMKLDGVSFLDLPTHDVRLLNR